LSEIVSDTLMVLGVGLIVTGCGFIYWPLWLILGGLALVAAGIVAGGKSLSREGTK
jgi:hypothetical protein